MTSDFKIKSHNKKDISSKSFITYKDGNQKYYSLRVNFVWMTRFLEISLINIPNLDSLKLLSCHSKKPIADFNEDELANLKSDDISLSKKEVEYLILNEIKIIDPFL